MPEIHPPEFEPGGSVRRARLTEHSTAIPNAVLLGYNRLSDGARLTYMVLESYDWPDKDGFSKGRCWPSIETIAAARGKSYDTVARHLKELEAAGLIRVESGRERGTPNCYWLLGPSAQEDAAYKDRFTGRPAERANDRFKETAPEGFSEGPGEFSPDEAAEREAPAPQYRPTPNLAPAHAPAFNPAAPSYREPRKYPAPSGSFAPPAPAILPEKEHEPHESNLKKFELEKDSNLFPTSTDRGGFTPQDRTRFAALNQSQDRPGVAARARGGGPASLDRPGSPYIAQIILDFSRALNDLAHAPSNQKQAQNLFRQSGLDEKAFVELLYEAKKRTQWAAIATPAVTGSGPNRAAYFFKVVRNLLDKT